MRRVYTKEMIDYLAKISPGRFNNQIAKMFNKRFNTNKTTGQIAAARYARGFVNGIDNTFKKGMHFSPSTEFKKGHVSHNKGRKGYCAPGSEKGWFKPGRDAQRYPVGTERTRKDGVYIKIAVPNTWILKSRHIWEQTYGKIPKDKCLLFIDQDRTNVTLDNLMLISKSVRAILCRSNMLTGNEGINQVQIKIAQIKFKTARRMEELN